MSRAETWITWLRTCSRGAQTSPGYFDRHLLGAITGQDSRALNAIDACWHLYASCDEDGRRAVLRAVRALLPAIQPQCRVFARLLIARALDWDDRARLWSRLDLALDDNGHWCTSAALEATHSEKNGWHVHKHDSSSGVGTSTGDRL